MRRPASAVIARLGDLQRIVLLQLALSGPAKPEPDSSSADKKGEHLGLRHLASFVLCMAHQRIHRRRSGFLCKIRP